MCGSDRIYAGFGGVGFGGGPSVLKIVRAAHTSCRNQCCSW